MEKEDLWPSDLNASVEGTAPVMTLRKQATFLGGRTANIVEGDVIVVPPDLMTKGDTFEFRFLLEAPALQAYRHELFLISHDWQYYPLKFHLDAEIKVDIPEDCCTKVQGYVVVKEPDEFEKVLKWIFAAKKTRRIIDVLIMQSNAGAIAEPKEVL